MSPLPWPPRLGDGFAAGQEADGGWSTTPVLDPAPPLAYGPEATAAFAAHFDTLFGALPAAVARRGAAA